MAIMRHSRIHFLQYPWKDSFVGMLLLEEPGHCVLIDSGLPETVDEFLLPYLEKNGIPLASLELVINTHCHGSHAGGNARLRELCDAKFAVHRSGAEAMEKSGFQPDILLEDGALLQAGGIRLNVVHLPGHTSDSIGILELVSGTMFTGDSLQGRGSQFSGIALYTDPDAYLQSVDRMETLFRIGRVRRLLCGHAFYPYDGKVSEADVTDFLEVCRDPVCAYEWAVTEYLEDHPSANCTEVEHVLLERHGVTRAPLLPGIGETTATAHLLQLV